MGLRSVVSNSLQPHGLYSFHGLYRILQARILEYGNRSPALQADSLPTELPGKPDGPQRERIIWKGSSAFSESWDTIRPCQLTDMHPRRAEQTRSLTVLYGRR